MDSTVEDKHVTASIDIAFLVDTTATMKETLTELPMYITKFFESLEQEIRTLQDDFTRYEYTLVVDWRAKVVGYRDFDIDGSDWYQDNPFVRDMSVLKRQITNMEAFGGMDEPESLLDAMYKLCNAQPSVPVGQILDTNAWRARSAAARVVFVFTDASYKEPMTSPEGSGGTVPDVIDLIQSEYFSTFLFAPDLPCYEELSCADKCEWESIEEPFADNLAVFCRLSDQDRIVRIVHRILHRDLEDVMDRLISCRMETVIL